MNISDEHFAGEYDSIIAETVLRVLQGKDAKEFSFKEFGGWINVRKKKRLIAEIDPDESIIYATNSKSAEPKEISGFLKKEIGGDWEICY
ncbi:MAG: hypothetical protein KKF67_04050 [Nanoarchaeota archaeon]|nr:hypothetical protein [Nanoarchaeota archaeon]